MLKQLIADQILSNILVDTVIHFRLRMVTFLQSLLGEGNSAQDAKMEAHMIAGRVFAGYWKDIPTNLELNLREILPGDVERSVAYDLKKNTAKYLEETLKIMWKAVKDGTKRIYFLPTRRSNIPCHQKFDTEAMAQLFISYKERMENRKLALDREHYND